MGQGHYAAIIFGTVEPWAVERAIAVRDGRPRGGPEFYYESRTPWVGYIVAANNGVADPRVGQAELKYTAVPLEDLVAHIAHQHAEAYARAVSRWEAYRLDFGLPEGKLILVADYD